MTSLLPSNPTKGSEGCNHVAQFNVRCCTSTYRTNIRIRCLLMHTKGGCKNATLQCMDFIYFKLQYKRNTYDRTTSEMRGSSPKIISGDSRRSENAQTHTHKHTIPNMKFKLKLLQIKCHVLGFTKTKAKMCFKR
jgi:hypothetical protein